MDRIELLGGLSIGIFATLRDRWSFEITCSVSFSVLKLKINIGLICIFILMHVGFCFSVFVLGKNGCAPLDPVRLYRFSNLHFDLIFMRKPMITLYSKLISHMYLLLKLIPSSFTDIFLDLYAHCLCRIDNATLLGLQHSLVVGVRCGTLAHDLPASFWRER